jgi:translation initiation factor eIF-2B subunit delta
LIDDPDYLNTTNREGVSHLKHWKENPHLKLLNLVYDVTPSKNITMVITEVGMIPPTSVPVVIREYRKDLPV